MIQQSRDKYSARTSGHFLRMQSIGSIWEKHKIKDYNSVRPCHTPLSFMTRQLTALKSGKHQRWQDFRKTNCRRTLWIFGFAHAFWFLIYSHAERASATWKQLYSWRQWSRTHEEKGQITHQPQSNFWFSENKLGNPNPYYATHVRVRQRPIEERERLEQQWKRWGLNIWSQSSSSSSTWWRHENGKNDKNNLFSFALKKEPQWFSFNEFRLQARAFPL